jgi:hypothetical protein
MCVGFATEKAGGSPLLRWAVIGIGVNHVAFSGKYILVGMMAPPPSLACSDRARRRTELIDAFKYKKEDGVNHLKSLNPKRQIQTVNRHDRSVNRQNSLALLSVVCHTCVC